MLFRYTENPSEINIFPPAEPPVSAVASAYRKTVPFPTLSLMVRLGWTERGWPRGMADMATANVNVR